MKYIKFLLLAIAAMVSISAYSDNYRFVGGNRSVETKICIAAAQDNVKRYRHLADTLSNTFIFGKRIQTMVAENLICNDRKVFTFAKAYNANHTAAFISRYMKKGVIIKEDVVLLSDPVKNKQLNDEKIIVVTANYAK